jgi:hypothetical protein
MPASGLLLLDQRALPSVGCLEPCVESGSRNSRQSPSLEVARMPKPSTVLSAEERTFLAKLLTSEAPVASTERSFSIDGGEAGNALLSSLATHSEMTLESHFQDFWMSFPVSLAEDEFHALRLKLGAPRIYDHGPNKRPWRLHLDSPITLQDANGEDTPLRIHELSPNGMLVDVAALDAAPTRLQLWLPLPDQERVEISATLVRAKGLRLAAYRLRPVRPDQAEQIRRFIFQQHRLQHPELAPSVPA